MHDQGSNAAAGIDAAIALKQQHDFALVPDMSVPHEQQLLQMASRADFLMEAGFDYLRYSAHSLRSLR